MMRALALVAVLAVTACATATPYQARAEGGYGYSEEAIETNRVRIAFRGNSLTERQTVEDYLLYRAAEATLERGFDHFILPTRNTDERSRMQSIGGSRFASRFDYWLYGPHFGWRGLYDPLWDDVTFREVTQYEASAEVVMGAGPKPAGNADAYDARDVAATLGPRIQRPPAG